MRKKGTVSLAIIACALVCAWGTSGYAGVLANWQFNEATSGYAPQEGVPITTADLTGHGYDLTAPGDWTSASWVTMNWTEGQGGAPNGAIHMAGHKWANEYFQWNGTEFSLLNGGTITAKIYYQPKHTVPDEIWNTIIRMTGSSAASWAEPVFELGADPSTKKLQLTVGSARTGAWSYLVSDQVVPENQWTTVQVAWQRDTVTNKLPAKMWINGVLAGETDNIDPHYTVPSSVWGYDIDHIEVSNIGPYPFSGCIDGIKLHDNYTEPSTGPELLADWQFNEAMSGYAPTPDVPTTTADLTGNGYNLTASSDWTSGSWITMNWTEGQGGTPNGAIHMAGHKWANEYFQWNGSNFTLLNAGTITAKIYYQPYHTVHDEIVNTIIRMTGSGWELPVFELSADPSTRILQFTLGSATTGGWGYLSSGVYQIPQNQWSTVQVAWERDLVTNKLPAKMWINGSLVGEIDNVDPHYTVPSSVWGYNLNHIEVGSMGPYPFSGVIDWIILSNQYNAESEPLVERGHRILMEKGLQVQASVNTGADPTLDYDRWAESNFTTVDSMYSHADTFNIKSGVPWARSFADASDFLTDNETPHLPDLVSLCLKDEQSITDPDQLAEITNWVAQCKVLYPDAIAFTNQPGVAYTEIQIKAYMAAAKPDMLMCDSYPFADKNGPGPVGGSPTDLYRDLQKYRLCGLAGNDDTGAKPIPYGLYLDLFKDVSNGWIRYPSDSEMRLNQFSAWAFGYKFVRAFVYNSWNGNSNGLKSPLFSSWFHTTDHMAMWQTLDNDTEGYIIYDLGDTYTLDGFHFWNLNYYYPDWNPGGYGIKTMDVYVSTDGNPSTATWTFLKRVTPAQATCQEWSEHGEWFNLPNTPARLVKFDIIDHFIDNPPGNGKGYTGFSEVKFFETFDRNPITGVTVAAFSSELSANNRFAVNTINGNGLYGDNGMTTHLPTTMFDQIAETNRQSRNLGSTLVRLLSTDVRMIRGLHGSPPGALNDLPSGMLEWTTGIDPYIQSITATNLGSKNNGLRGDVLVGYFKPLLESDDGPEFTNEIYFMITNGLSDRDGLVSETRQRIVIDFNFGASGITSLQRLSRHTGTVGTVSLISLGGAQYRLTLDLDGGTGNLFKFNTGAPFVGAPLAGIAISGAVELQNLTPDEEGYEVTFEVRDPSTGDLLDNQTLALDSGGTYTLNTSVAAGTYDVYAKASHWLRQKVSTTFPGTGVDFSLINGDSDGDNEVTSTDLSIVLAAMDVLPVNSQADLNGDTLITSADLSICLTNMDMVGN